VWALPSFGCGASGVSTVGGGGGKRGRKSGGIYRAMLRANKQS
jgi:hypothetical protein